MADNWSWPAEIFSNSAVKTCQIPLSNPTVRKSIVPLDKKWAIIGHYLNIILPVRFFALHGNGNYKAC